MKASRRERLVEHVRMPLYRDGYALAANSAFTAVAGLVYWVVAARRYGAHDVGVNAALISSMMFLAGIAGLNLTNVVVGVGEWAPSLDFLRDDRLIGAWFVLSTLGWAVFAIQDSVLTALGRAVWVPIENAVFSLLKLALLAVFATLLPVYGIFVSWTGAMLVSVAGVNFLVFTLLMRRTPARPARATTLRSRAFARYFAA